MPTDDFARAREAMVDRHLRSRGITDPRVIAAFLSVPREEFVLPGDRARAYDDQAIGIGHGQTISQPYMVAHMITELQVESHHRVLEVGAGSGYQAALLGQLAAEVYAVEIIPGLVITARQTIERLGYTNVHIIQADGTLGYPPAAPYDRIIVAAAAPTVPPPLAEQLAEGGRLVAPLGGRGYQECVTAVRQGEELVVRRGTGCTFVPLRGEHGWPEEYWPGG